MGGTSPPDEMDVLIRDAIERLPEEVHREAVEWINRARSGSPGVLELELKAESKRALEKFHAAAAAVERIIGR
jgi:hypothetical protein